MLKRIYSFFGMQTEHLSEVEARRYMSVPRFTYRNCFPEVFSLTSDSGWGCCFRSAQGLIASFIFRYVAEVPEVYCQNFPEISPLCLFEDHQDMPFSIQNLVTVCKDLGVEPGTWAKPSQLSAAIIQILKDHNIDVIKADDSYINKKQLDNIRYPALVLIPTLLGIDDLDPNFIPFLKTVLKRKELVGVVSGYSCSAFYFVGLTDDEENAIYFDPHVTHKAVLSYESHEDFFSQPAKAMNVSKMNPSVLIGFICLSKEEGNELLDAITNIKNSPVTTKEINPSLINQVIDIDDLDL